MSVPEDVAAGLVVPRELVQAWILLIMALIRAVADDYYGWEEQLDKSMDKLQTGMSQMVASLPGPHLGSSALVLPMDLLSLMLPRLLSDSNGHYPGYSQIYSSYLQELVSLAQYSPHSRPLLTFVTGSRDNGHEI